MTHSAERYELQLPFAGFYGSIHDSEIDHVVERIGEDWEQAMDSYIPDDLLQLFWDGASFASTRLEYSKFYADAFGDEYLDGDCTFTAMTSPREYNFATDRIFATIGAKTLAKLGAGVDEQNLDRIAADRHTSYDGFISSYKADWRGWGPVTEWDHNQLETLLLAYLETERGEAWDQWAEYALCEDMSCNGMIDGWLWGGDDPKLKRGWKLFNYLTYDRKNRAVKTMEQWRKAFAKPWSDTPLGAFSQA